MLSKPTTSGPRYRNRRELLLFLLAVLLPSVLVGALAFRLAQQERELRSRERAEAVQRAARELGRNAYVQLERIRLNQLVAPAPPAPAALRLRARLGAERAAAVEVQSDAAVPRTAAFAAALRRAEAEEFAGSAQQAVLLYERALPLAGTGADSALARLGMARVLPDSARARALLREIAALSPALRDDQEVPIAFYAARRLADWPQERAAVREGMHAFVDSAAMPNAVTAYMLAEIVDLLAREGAANDSTLGALQQRSTAAVQDAEQAVSLSHDLPTLLRLMGTVENGDGAQWQPYGDPLWLVNVTPTADGMDSLVLAVDAAQLLAEVAADSALIGTPLAGARLANAGQGELLGPQLPGLRAVLPAPSDDSTGNGLGGALLALLLGVTFFSAYLFWRDVQREARTAQVRSRFVASVSHELKTPLTSIRMFAETLRMGRGSAERNTEYLDTIVGESERLSRLINNVLEFSRIEEGRKTYRLAPTDLGDVVRDAARAMSYPLSQEQFELRLDVAPGVPPVAADRDALMQAVLNLLSNAVKFSNGSRAIDLGLAADDGRALIHVHDRGIGITPADRARIFDKYYRSPDVERRGIAGAGLGLPLVLHVAEAHGGGVDVESTPGDGTTFTLWLPLQEGA